MKAKLTGLFLLLGILASQAQDKPKVNISGTKFTYPLVEKWIIEYRKTYPTADIQLVSNAGESVTIQIIAYHPESSTFGENKQIIPVSRFALLPVGNGN
jgi:ABC-type phosphate transport system substrate-binding protein